MASFEPLIRMNENAFRAHNKMQTKTRRKPLGDVTNSSKPLAKDKSSVKDFSVFKAAQEKAVQPKTGRKPLGDLTNSNRPRANQKSSKKNCIENLSAVSEENNVHNCGLGEGFLHNHSECTKAQRQSMTMNMDYFLDTVALKRDSSVPVPAPRLPQLSTATNLELNTSMELDELELDVLDICSPPASPTPKSPTSPSWGMDWKNLDFSPLKLKESPPRKY